jgi:hypothetical protein
MPSNSTAIFLSINLEPRVTSQLVLQPFFKRNVIDKSGDSIRKNDADTSSK